MKNQRVDIRTLFPMFMLLFAISIGIGQQRDCLAEQPQPNIVFIFADDLCHDMIRQLGKNDEINTPNLDRLARMGTSFSNCYNMGSWCPAVCVSSRTMLNTGRTIWHAGYITGDKRIVPKNDGSDTSKFKWDQYASNIVGPTSVTEVVKSRATWSQLLEDAGYDTYMAGKWHVRGIKAQDVFKFTKNVRGGMPNQTNKRYNRKFDIGQPDTWQPWDESNDGFWKGGKHWSEILGDDACEFIEQAKKNDNPFFMYVAFNAPHDPRQSPKRFVDQYPLAKIAVPESFLPTYPFHVAMGCGPNLRDERLAPFPRSKHSVQVNRKEYYAIISHMDEQIGRMLESLENSGKMQDTYIFFSADHGLAVGRHGLLGKQSMYEHSMKPPFLAVGPKFKQQANVDGKVYLQDVVPTVLQLANVEAPDWIEFKSLLPIAEGTKNENYSRVFGAYDSKQRMLVEDSFKIILYPAVGKVRLYDLRNDPQELTDLSNMPNQQYRIRKMMKSFVELQREVNDPLTLPNEYSYWLTEK